MRATPTGATGTALVSAARDGDRDALNELARRHLPLVYNLVRRALNDSPDIDDIVQDVMLRALRQLPKLRTPESFRPWLAAIALRQIATHRSTGEVAARRLASLDQATHRPDPRADIEQPAILRAEVTRQRRQVSQAARWLTAEERAVFSLWWLETAGELDRTETAAALHVSVAHAGVRLQRMRTQLDLSRSVVAALEAVPGCPGLDSALTGWNGTPAPAWRKRLARHVRECPVCRQAVDGSVPTERLLLGLAVFPVPAALTAGLLSKDPLGSAAVTSSTKGLILSKLTQLTGSHPVAATMAAGALAISGTATTAAWTGSPHTSAAVIAAPLPPGTGVRSAPPVGPVTLPEGKVSLESVNAEGRFVSATDQPGTLAALTASSPAPQRRAATFEVVRGFADPNCYSFRAADGRYVRHQSFRLRLSPDEGTVLFQRDATFCARAGAGAGAVSFESFNYTGYFLRHLDGDIWLDQFDGSTTFRADSSFRAQQPLG
ncbi:sigma-70 family RNA polymerase sigma factor [Actinoplanes sp. GCM10030250]|uniref:sigma-70 family RNA polymerase sigma factor n=1 Tax=Actinoplanes sp. GCM10030250 TaxID=3273376 RepID=UPI0036163172